MVKTWEQICLPADNDSEIYPNGNNWNWDSESRSTANGLKHILQALSMWLHFCCQKNY